MKFISSKEASSLWEISDRALCQRGQIQGAKKDGGLWLIPFDALKPIDMRSYRNKNIEEQYIELFKQIDSKKDYISKRRSLTKGELQQLKEEFLIEFTYDSNAIEGSTLSLQETALVLEGMTIAKKPIKEHLEAIGHKDAFLYVEQLVKDNSQLTERVVKDIHSLVLIDRPENKGIYRKISVKVLGGNFETTAPLQIECEMETLYKTYSLISETHHTIEAVAWFHRKFEKIHPFIDGNGRTGRLILNMKLMKKGYPVINIKYLDRQRYYNSFKSVAMMTNLISEYIDEQLNKYIKIVKIK